LPPRIAKHRQRGSFTTPAGRTTRARGQPAHSGCPRRRLTTRFSTATCCSRASILHDIWQKPANSLGVGFDYTIEGTLLGHIQMGIDMVEKAIASLPRFPPGPPAHTGSPHGILSHHGKLEFGSPKLADDSRASRPELCRHLDAKMQAVSTEFDKSIREGKGPDELTGKCGRSTTGSY